MTIAEATAYLEAAGYRVSKARAKVRADGIQPGRPTGKGHGEQCAEHWRVPGYTRALCVLQPGVRDDGLPIGPDWTDRERVLAFAVEMRTAWEARIAAERAGSAAGGR